MRTTERYACIDCERDMTRAGLVHWAVPGSETGCKCAFCKQRRYCTKYRIQYGREKEA